MPAAAKTQSGLPFLSRYRTVEAISDLAGDGDERLVIYCGAGVTIDRSNLGWRDLVSGLLTPYIPAHQARDDIFRTHGVLEAASLAVEYYAKDYGKDQYIDRLVDRLRLMLYVPGDWQAGILADAVARLSLAYHDSRSGCVVATPNYDTYLIEAMRKVFARVDVKYTTTKDFLRCQHGEVELEGWVKKSKKVDQLFSRGSVCIQLHGVVPHNETIEEGRSRSPVIGELDYIRSEKFTYKGLRALFSKSPVILVGTSMTDKPLLRALADTARSGHSRYAIVPLDLGTDRQRRMALQESSAERYEHFGVTPLYVDYHFQVAQFLEELRLVVNHDVSPSGGLDSETLVEPPVRNGYVRYGRRLLAWSEAWADLHSDSESPRTMVSSALLEFAESEIRRILDLSESEVTKVELWVRDQPDAFRGLRLWQSTASLHLQEESARRATFSNSSEIAAVRAFVEGRPIVSTLEAGASPHQRWRTYIAIPVRHSSFEFDDRLPIGTIVLASMRPAERGRLLRTKRRESLHEAFSVLEWAAKAIVSTETSSGFDAS